MGITPPLHRLFSPMKNSSCMLALLLPLAFTACVSRPLLIIESRLHRNPTTVIEGSDNPVVVVNSGSWQGPYATFKVQDKATGQVVMTGTVRSAREYAVSGSGFNPDDQRPTTQINRFLVPFVGDGTYVVELWVEGKRVDSTEFSVTGHGKVKRHEPVSGVPAEVQDLMHAARSVADEWAKTAPAITSRVGLVLEVKVLGSRTEKRTLDTANPVSRGQANLSVRGSDGTERVTVYWEQDLRSGAFRVVRATAADGSDLPL